MTRKDVLTLAAIVVAFTVLALVIPLAKAADSFGMPGDLTVGDDLTVSGDAVVDLKLSVGDTASFLFYNCPDIRQQYVIQWDESAQTGKAYPDTFLGNMVKRAIFSPVIETNVEYVVLFMDDAGAGWDSLTVNLYAGEDAAGDTSIFTSYGWPMLEPGDGDKARTNIVGRDGALDAIQKTLVKGEVLYLDAELYGGKGDPPAGIRVDIYLEPDYMQD